MFTVDTDRIQAAASDMSGIAGEIESSVGAMHARLTSLEGSWTGAAATEFQGAGQRVDRACRVGSAPTSPRSRRSPRGPAAATPRPNRACGVVRPLSEVARLLRGAHQRHRALVDDYAAGSDVAERRGELDLRPGTCDADRPPVAVAYRTVSERDGPRHG